MSAARDAALVAGAFVSLGKRVSTQSVPMTRRYGLLVQTQARANASGRPGPRAITGHHRRSITSKTTVTPAAVEAIIGPTSPQGRRLELGFVGVDSAGRHYHQPPFPYLQPAMDKYAEQFIKEMESLVYL